MRTLVVPPAALRDENAIQMLSAWIAEKSLHCVMNIGMWKEGGKNEVPAWGILIADTVRHVARAMQEQYGYSEQETIRVILESLDKELMKPTSKLSGEFHHGHS